MRVVLTDTTNAASAGAGRMGIQIGVFTESGLFYPLGAQGQTANGGVFELAVPYEHDLRLGFLGKPLLVKLDQVPVDTRSFASAKFRIPRGGPGVKEFAIDVTGAAK